MNHRHPDSEQTEGRRRLVVVQDHLQPCPYLAETARMPLEVSVGKLDGDDADALLAAGYRRSGVYLYRTRCPICQACQPTRLRADQFNWSRSMQRVLKRGDRDLRCHWGTPIADDRRVQLFNDHRRLRKLSDGDEVDLLSYEAFLTETCFSTTELAITLDDLLIAVAIVDWGRTSFSAVYTHFAPEFSRYSLGTYAVLKQIQRVLDTGREFLYLGLYVAANPHLSYKARFSPQERLIEGKWVPIAEGK
ncbi:arginyltransferase [Stieleria varia]|uniref:Arginyl-tRNA-protein transferase n=1 Tax=Stieleria varia TaxID=2528005 RepID=A0A5C6A3L7_9BACT|nr:arginyltransferase [Stieleria varia]TWT93801.1 arginyl-tRNA-protein transferase [Stieleria varia]